MVTEKINIVPRYLGELEPNYGYNPGEVMRIQGKPGMFQPVNIYVHENLKGYCAPTFNNANESSIFFHGTSVSVSSERYSPARGCGRLRRGVQS